MTSIVDLAQPGLFIEDAMAGFSLEWALTGDTGEALAALAKLVPGQSIVGLGSPLVAAAGGNIPALHPFAAIEGQAGMPSTQNALWAYVLTTSPGDAFVEAERLGAALGGAFEMVESTALFRYRDGRDLTGYKDGTANPKADEIADVALIGSGPASGGSFALVQRYVHFRTRFDKLAESDRDDVIGRRLSDNEEFDAAPEISHVKRTDQEGYAEPAFMLRRSMPWGDPRTHGLQFVAFSNDLNRIDTVLRRMCGLEDGKSDALLRYTQAETGGYYYCPPVKAGHLDLVGVRA